MIHISVAKVSLFSKKSNYSIALAECNAIANDKNARKTLHSLRHQLMILIFQQKAFFIYIHSNY